MAKRVTKKSAAKKGTGKSAKKAKSAKKSSSKKASTAKKATKKTTQKAATKKTTKKASAKKPAAKKTTKPAGTSAPSKKSTKKKAKAAKKTSPPRKVSRLAEPEPASQEEPKKIKSPLNKKDLESFRQLLLAKRAMLTNDVTTMTDQALRGSAYADSGELSSMPIHMADLGSDNFEQEFTLGLIQNEHAVLREIDEALQRIDEGTFGICLGTGKPIAKARLRAKPWAKYCIEHARKLERGF